MRDKPNCVYTIVRTRCGQDDHTPLHALHLKTHTRGKAHTHSSYYTQAHTNYPTFIDFFYCVFITNRQCVLTVCGMRIADLNDM